MIGYNSDPPVCGVPPQLDVTADEQDVCQVEVTQRQNGAVLYVNFNGVCILRVCRLKNLRVLT